MKKMNEWHAKFNIDGTEKVVSEDTKPLDKDDFEEINLPVLDLKPHAKPTSNAKIMIEIDEYVKNLALKE